MIRIDVGELAQTLESNAAELAELVASFPLESRLQSLGDEFCVVEHACHLRDLERDGFTPRIHSVLAEDDPLLYGFDGNGVAAASNYRSEHAITALNAFLEARKANVDTVRALPEAGFLRIGHYEDRAPITLGDVVAAMLDHDRDHLGRLHRMLEQTSV
jgi:DinB superfamily